MSLALPIIAEKSRQTSIKVAGMLLSQIETEPFVLVLKMKLNLTEGNGSSLRQFNHVVPSWFTLTAELIWSNAAMWSAHLQGDTVGLDLVLGPHA